MYDVLIIGGGVTGSSIARELSRYKLKIAVIERASDVCEGTSKANSGIAHAGYDAESGTLKAKLNVRGSELMEPLSRELGFIYRRCGSMVLCFDEKDMDKLKVLKDRGDVNGVKDLSIITGDEARKLEANLSPNVVGALLVPTGGIVDPFGLTVAMADNAVMNGAEFILNSEVVSISKENDIFTVKVKKHPSTLNMDASGEESYEAKVVINAAGVYADRIHNMVSDKKIEITPRRGEYMLLDNTVGDYVTRTIFQLPTDLGKGILITPTAHGNLLVGPTANDIDDKEDTETTAEGLGEVKLKSVLSSENVPLREVITSFSGLRARLTKNEADYRNYEEEHKKGDFLIGELNDVPGFIDVAGIESPGLSCAPAIGEYVTKLVKDIITLEPKEDFIAARNVKKPFVMSTDEEREALVKEDPKYANVICRCCSVTEGEIVKAIHSPVGATTTDGIKRRTGAGMGRCQSGFCNPKVVEILSRELGVDPSLITKNDAGSYYIL